MAASPVSIPTPEPRPRSDRSSSAVPGARRLQDDERNLALSLALVVVVVRPLRGHQLPQLRLLLGRRVPRPDPEAVAEYLELRVGVRLQVQVPGRVLRQASLGGDQQVVVTVLAVDQRSGALLAALAAGRREQGDRRALPPDVALLAVGGDVAVDVL